MRHGKRVEREGAGAEHGGGQDGHEAVGRGNERHGNRSQKSDEGREHHHDAPVDAVGKAAERPLQQRATEHDRAHERGDAGHVEALVLREHRTQRPEGAIGEPDGEAAGEADRRHAIELA